jgi:hypothetical protein
MLRSLLGPERIKITLWTTIIAAIAAALIFFDHTGDPVFPIFLGVFAWQAFQQLKEERWR